MLLILCVWMLCYSNSAIPMLKCRVSDMGVVLDSSHFLSNFVQFSFKMKGGVFMTVSMSEYTFDMDT